MKAQQKISRYTRIYEQLETLVLQIPWDISRSATIVAVLHHKFPHFFWTGFYFLNEGELRVGPYQGPLACQQLKKGTGVCWAGINQQKAIVVPDVEKFSGHIACSPLSKSEIVVPVFDTNKNVIGVLDIDSKTPNAFDEVDVEYLEKIAALVCC